MATLVYLLDEDGLTLPTQAELVEFFTEKYETIYGADVNLDQDSPDGQMMMINIQAILDMQELLMQIYNSFDPDNAMGVVLDQRVSINGIQRQAGTHTVTNVTITTTQALNLFGVDQTLEPVFEVQDNAGNVWQLISSISIGEAGDHILAFQAAEPGAVQTVPNTITTPVSVVLGVSNINNPTTYTTLGINEESDAALKVRRQKSVSLSSQGYLAGLRAALLNISGMADAFIYENVTGATDGDDIPGHSIWVIASGTASPAAIANAIYTKRNAGCGMKGDQTYNITQADGSVFTIRWDNVEAETLFIKFTATSLDGVNPVDIAAIRAGLVTGFVPGVAEQVNINTLANAVREIDPNCLVTAAGFSLTEGGSYTNTLTPSGKNMQFAVTEPNIIILPVVVSPSSSEAVDAEVIEFSALGGFGEYTWTIEVDNSGGSIDSSTGEYTAGPTPGTDTIRATDDSGNYGEATVVVS